MLVPRALTRHGAQAPKFLTDCLDLPGLRSKKLAWRWFTGLMFDQRFRITRRFRRTADDEFGPELSLGRTVRQECSLDCGIGMEGRFK